MDKLSTLLKRTWKNGNMALRNFLRVQHRETKMKMRRSVEDTLRGPNSHLIGIAEKTENDEVRLDESLQTLEKHELSDLKCTLEYHAREV